MTTTNRQRLGWGIVLATVLLAVAFAGAQDNGRKVTGVVVSASSLEPVPGAHVEYEDVDTSLGIQTTTTDDKGRFEIAEGLKGVITVTANRYGTARRGWPRPDPGQLRIALLPPAIVRGNMLDLVSGRAAEGTVTVIMHNRYNTVSDSAETVGGSFRIEDAPPGLAMVLARADGFAPYFSTFDVEAGKDYSLRVGLLLEATATGLVLDRNDRLVEGALITAHYDERLQAAGLYSSLAGGIIVTGDDGKFWINGLVPDTPIGLQASLDGWMSEIVTVNMGPGSVWRDVVLRMPW